MDHPQTSSHSAGGLIYVAVSFISGALGWISLHSVKENLQVASLLISCGAGLMAMRHYYLQNKKVK